MSDKDHHQAGGGAFKISQLAFPPLGATRHNDPVCPIISRNQKSGTKENVWAAKTLE